MDEIAYPCPATKLVYRCLRAQPNARAVHQAKREVVVFSSRKDDLGDSVLNSSRADRRREEPLEDRIDRRQTN